MVLTGRYRVLHECAGSSRIATAALVLVVALALGLTACGADSGRASQISAAETIRGFIVEVEAKSIVELGSLDVEDPEGVTWHFVGRDFKGVSPSHLREHMVQGLPVSVTFHRENGTLVIEEVTD